MKRDASSVIMSSQPEKCRCFSKRLNIGINFVAVLMHCPFFMINRSVTDRKCGHNFSLTSHIYTTLIVNLHIAQV